MELQLYLVQKVIEKQHDNSSTYNLTVDDWKSPQGLATWALFGVNGSSWEAEADEEDCCVVVDANGLLADKRGGWKVTDDDVVDVGGKGADDVGGEPSRAAAIAPNPAGDGW